MHVARRQMTAALILLDAFSRSAAAATLDMAIHQLDRELAMPPDYQADPDDRA